MMRVRPLCFLLLFLALSSAALAAQEAAESLAASATAQTTAITAEQLEELRRRLEVLAAEVERLRSGEPDQRQLSDERRRALGLAPSAAATYRRASRGVSFAGYGEMLLENFRSENESGGRGAPTTRIDLLRATLYAGYRFNDKFLFNSEIEVEHGNELSIEFAYVDYLVNDTFSLRGGLLLLPLGLVNEFHEPTVYLGAKRSETEQRILPSTWRENGGGILATAGTFNVRAYVTNGLNGSAFRSNGVRGGRQRGIQARAANIAFSGRVDVTPVPGIFAGVGFYNGGSGQELVFVGGQPLDMDTRITEVHVQAQRRGFDIRALFAHGTIDDAGAASRALGLAPNAPIPEAMRGGYVQVGYNVLSPLSVQTAVTPYLRFEHVDTQHKVPAGFTRAAGFGGEFTSVGVDVKPIPNVVIKTEYQRISNDARTGRNQLNVNLGYAF